ncbi:hypothetical protein CHARACLAT_022737 [Characodon lateralis]|uniref:Epidermal growth factor receptor substrate 15 n=1 Tax=Characodon lateralis TaxID=208331 RepID=A0ABU7EM29_9TELE|nr:hypothetical protein [Characodon lateralis]
MLLVQGTEVAVFEKRGEASSADTWLSLGGVGLHSLTCLSSVANHFCLLCWTPREKSSVEEEIKEKEEAIRQRTDEVQDLQDEVAKETEELQRLQSQRQKIQEALDELDQQKTTLEEQLSLIRQQTSQETQLISSLQSEHEDQEQKICQYEEELIQAREELLALQEESRRLQEKVQAAQEQLTPLQESVRDSFTQVSQVQQKVQDLRVEERSVTAQLSWKRALEDSSPVMVNGSADSTAELDLFNDDLPMELKDDEPAVFSNQQKEYSDEKEREGVNEKEGEKEQSTKAPEEDKSKPDALDDLFSRLASTDMYSSLSNISKTRDNPVGQENHSFAPDVSSEVSDDEESLKETPLKVDSPEPESQQEPAESTETTPSPLPPQVGPRSLPPQTSPPSLPEMDFFHSDPFTDHDPFKEDPFGKADVADPFGGDPFKGSDPFAADSFFTQPSSTTFPSKDPFSASADPFGTTPGIPEPDLFAAKAKDASAPPSAATPDPFASNTTKPPPASKDPFSSTGDNVLDSDPFGSKMNNAGEVDPFSSQEGGSDPFSSSSTSSDLAVKDSAPSNDPFAPGGTTVSTTSDPDPFAAVFGNESFGGGFADFSALAKYFAGPIPSPPHYLPVTGVSAHRCTCGFQYPGLGALVSAGSLLVAACWGLDPWAQSGICFGSDVSRGLGSLGPWLDLLGRRQLPAGPVGSSLQLPEASALWLLGGSPETLLCSSLGGLR